MYTFIIYIILWITNWLNSLTFEWMPVSYLCCSLLLFLVFLALYNFLHLPLLSLTGWLEMHCNQMVYVQCVWCDFPYTISENAEVKTNVWIFHNIFDLNTFVYHNFHHYHRLHLSVLIQASSTFMDTQWNAINSLRLS